MLKLEHLIVYALSSYGEYLDRFDEMADEGREIVVYVIMPTDVSGRLLIEGTAFLDTKIMIKFPTMFAPLDCTDMFIDLLNEKKDRPIVINLSSEFMDIVYQLHQMLSL